MERNKKNKYETPQLIVNECTDIICASGIELPPETLDDPSFSFFGFQF